MSFIEKEIFVFFDNMYIEFLKIVSKLGYIDILMELIKCLGKEKYIFFYEKLLIVVCEVGYLNVVLELIKLGVDVN